MKMDFVWLHIGDAVVKLQDMGAMRIKTPVKKGLKHFLEAIKIVEKGEIFMLKGRSYI